MVANSIILGIGTAVAAIATLLSGVFTLSQLTLGARLRGRLSKDLEAYEKLPDGPVKELLLRSIHHTAAWVAAVELERVDRRKLFPRVLVLLAIATTAIPLVPDRGYQSWRPALTYVAAGIALGSLLGAYLVAVAGTAERDVRRRRLVVRTLKTPEQVEKPKP